MKTAIQQQGFPSTPAIVCCIHMQIYSNNVAVCKEGTVELETQIVLLKTGLIGKAGNHSTLCLGIHNNCIQITGTSLKVYNERDRMHVYA